jgi:hypothetical protein
MPSDDRFVWFDDLADDPICGRSLPEAYQVGEQLVFNETGRAGAWLEGRPVNLEEWQ